LSGPREGYQEKIADLVIHVKIRIRLLGRRPHNLHSIYLGSIPRLFFLL